MHFLARFLMTTPLLHGKCQRTLEPATWLIGVGRYLLPLGVWPTIGRRAAAHNAIISAPALSKQLLWRPLTPLAASLSGLHPPMCCGTPHTLVFLIIVFVSFLCEKVFLLFNQKLQSAYNQRNHFIKYPCFSQPLMVCIYPTPRLT